MSHAKYIWMTDLHLNWSLPGTKARFVSDITKQEPSGLIISGDISHGLTVCRDLRYLAENLSIPIYFVLGNHEYSFRSASKLHIKIKRLTAKYSNLHWMTEEGVLALESKSEDKVAIIGTEGWYDGRAGSSRLLKYTLDWILMPDIRRLPTMADRIKKFQSMADDSAEFIKNKLLEALVEHDTVYILTHFPPYVEASEHYTLFSKFWKAYNINYVMGQAIEDVMKDYPNKKVVVLSGHVHRSTYITVASNILCLVGAAKYCGMPNRRDTLYL